MAANNANTSSMERTPRIAIIGAGFAGLCLAIGLLRSGLRVQVYEAHSMFAEIGAGITFSVNGLRAMELLDPRIASSFYSKSTSHGHGSGRELFWDCRNGQSDSADKICSVEGTAFRSIHRAVFLRILSENLPPECVCFGMSLTEIKQGSNEVKLIFESGKEVTVDAVVGADGIKSTVRRFVHPELDSTTLEPSYHGVYLYRALIPMTKAIKEIGKELAMTAQNYVGIGAHLITYPIENGDLLNVAAVKRDGLKVWPHENWQVRTTRSKMLQDFDNFGEPVRKIVSMIDIPDQWAGHDLSTPLHSFFNGKLVVIGDAAHCTTPHQGAGGAQAIEDAFILSRLFRRFPGLRSIPKIFKAFDHVRRPRTERVITTSRDAAKISHLSTVDMDEIPKILDGRYDWIWYIDLEQHLADAVEYYSSIDMQ